MISGVSIASGKSPHFIGTPGGQTGDDRAQRSPPGQLILGTLATAERGWYGVQHETERRPSVHLPAHPLG